MKKILFLDNQYIDFASQVNFLWGVPKKISAGPVITKTAEWEMLFTAYGSMHKQPNGLAMYYTMWQLDQKPPYARLKTGICYAQSADGITWNKPDLNIVKEINKGKNNLLYWGDIADQPNVIKTDKALTGFEFALIYYGCVRGQDWAVRICYSNDGLYWNWPGTIIWQTPSDKKNGEIDFYAGDDAISLFYDSDKKKYFLYRKVMQDFDLIYNPQKHADWLPDKNTLCRMIAVAESENLAVWSNHQIIMKPDGIKEPYIDYHKFAVTKLNSGGYLGLLEVHDGSPGKKQISLDLLYSPSGLNWKRGSGSSTQFLKNQSPSDWDYGMKFTNSSFLIETKDTMYFYYGAIKASLEHDQALVSCTGYGVGLCTLPVNGIRSVGAGQTEGTVVTTPVEIEKNIYLKAEIEEGGWIKAILLNPQNLPLALFNQNSIKPLVLSGNRCSLEFVDPPRVRIGICKIKFLLKKARLYAVYFNED